MNCGLSKVAFGTLLGFLCFVCYWNSLSGDLVHDDVFAIRDNQDVRPHTPLIDIFTNDFWGKPMSDPTSHKSYRPFTVITFRINYAIHGLEPWGYHLVNIILHAISTLLVWQLCTSVVFVKQPWLSFQAAVLFAVHPIHTEAVAGVVGRADVLSCTFFILSFLFYHDCVISKSNYLSYILKLLLCIVTGTLAMLSKEQGVTSFGVCILFDLFNSFIFRSENISSIKSLIIRIVVMLITILMLMVFRIHLLYGSLPHFSAYDNPASFADSCVTRLLTYCYLYFYNFYMLIFPSVLCYDWQMDSIKLVDSVYDMRNVWTVGFFLYISAAVWCITSSGSNERVRMVTFLAFVIVVIPFLPASNIFFRVGFVLAERILYIPSIGTCILVVYGLYLLTRCVIKPFKTVISLSYMLIVCLFMIKTIHRNPVWESRQSLFESGIAVLPNNAKIHYNYANFLKDTGSIDKAISHYKKAVTLSPDHSSAHNNLATLLIDVTEVEYHLKQAIIHNPHHYKAHFNLANTLWNSNNVIEAEKYYRETLRINPNYTDAIIKLSSLLSTQGRYDESEALLDIVLQSETKNADVLHNVAGVLVSNGKRNQAITLYKDILGTNPSHHASLLGLAKIYRSLEENKLAESLFKRALVINPSPSTYQLLGALYFNTGKLEESFKTFEDGLILESDNSELICSYSQVAGRLDKLLILEELAKRFEQNYCVRFSLANALSQHKQQLQNAFVHSTVSIELAHSDKSMFDAYTLHATILKDLKRFQEAAVIYEKASLLYPQTTSSWINLGAGNYSRAKHYYLKAIALEPNNIVAKSNLDKLNKLNYARTSQK